jgi:hypothetical protein
MDAAVPRIAPDWVAASVMVGDLVGVMLYCAKPNQLPATTEPLVILATGLIPVNCEASHPFDSIESAGAVARLMARESS